MTNCVEHVTNIDGSQVKLGKHKDLKEDSFINGYVTIIKNVGKPDEQTLCKDKHNLLTTDWREQSQQPSLMLMIAILQL